MKSKSIVVGSVLLLWAAPGQASIFNNGAKWPQTSPGGVLDINVCMVDGSTTGAGGDPDPALNEVVYQIQRALESAWTRTGTVRFHDWRMCSELTTAEQQQAIGFYIDPDAANYTYAFGPSGLGRVTASNYTVGIKPWGNDSHCFPFSDFSCAQQYAIHEFGHVLGFEHKMKSPVAPAGCHDSSNSDVSSYGYGTEYPNSYTYTVFDPSSPGNNGSGLAYDWTSIMAYNVNSTSCANVNGDRFGDFTLDPTDEQSLQSVYPQDNGFAIPIVYSDWNFEGNALPLYSSSYTMQTLKMVGNDSVSSIRVPPGWTVYLYADDNFGGSVKTFTEDTSYVGDDFNDITSSIWAYYNGWNTIPAPVYVYENDDGGGRYQALWAPVNGETRTYDIDQLTMGNDMISAVKFASLNSRVQIVLWENAGCTGQSKTYYSDDTDAYQSVLYVGDDFNDITSCIQVSTYYYTF